MTQHKGKPRSRNSARRSARRFPWWWILPAIGLMALAAWALGGGGQSKAAAPEATGAPKIRVDRDTQDFGDVKLGLAPIQTAVRVTNAGDRPLTFMEAPYIEVLEGC